MNLCDAIEPLPPIEDEDFACFIDRFADARVVLLGEASHGTSEYYRARSAISRRLIERHGFDVVAIEGDWPDAEAVDRWIGGRADEWPEDVFDRFPRWMWRNREFVEFADWMRRQAQEGDQGAALYGLDLYSLSGSMRAVIDYLERVDPEAAQVARDRYACLAPFQREPALYGRLARHEGYARCEDAVVDQLVDLFRSAHDYSEKDGEAFFGAAQNARLVANAEHYYRAMYRGSAESWNLRDGHMFETLDRILDVRGPGSKAIVWAHNSHIGDARHTDMGRERGQHNLGQLCREEYGDQARLVGLGTHGGTVAAADDWDGPMRVKQVNPSRPDSFERRCHECGEPRFFLDLREVEEGGLGEVLQRYIGVIYRPETERWSHYSAGDPFAQYDGWLWFDRSHAIHALDDDAGGGADELYPSGL